MRTPVAQTYVTVSPWAQNLQHPMYGTSDTYRLAADWLRGCEDVADWGGGSGHFREYLDASTPYVVVDGTMQCGDGDAQVLADLTRYRTPADGILLRHVLDQSEQWRDILGNALTAFRRRLAVVTYTPDAVTTGVIKMKSGWPILHFNPADVRAEMGAFLVSDRQVHTSHPERIYYLERPR